MGWLGGHKEQRTRTEVLDIWRGWRFVETAYVLYEQVKA